MSDQDPNGKPLTDRVSETCPDIGTVIFLTYENDGRVASRANQPRKSVNILGRARCGGHTKATMAKMSSYFKSILVVRRAASRRTKAKVATAKVANTVIETWTAPSTIVADKKTGSL